MYWPLRKCYHIAKFGIVLTLVVALLTLFEQWRGGKRAVGAQFTNPVDAELERQVLDDEARIVPGLGEGGAAVYLQGEEKKLGEESEKKLAMNVYLSDRIPYNRTLRDYRHPACARVVYDAELPSASVVIIFHNEPYSVVVRTLWSVVNSARRDLPYYRTANYVDRDTGRTMNLGYPGQDPSSPLVYLKEIILVDDNSTLPELKGKLSHYVRTRMPPGLIRIMRLPDREGLTRARLAGARYASGDVLVFLDAHCEVVTDWLRPLLHRIKHAPSAVLVPIIDVIEASTFYYSIIDKTVFQGLMMARMRGARVARGDVLVFLDAHCEPGADWLRPLLQRVRHKRDAVVTPLIDIIDQTTFTLDAAQKFQVGGFTFAGHFTWIDVPERERKRRGSDISPTWSPTMAGGLFAINRAYYWELGAYDEQMAGWGGENLELSFRIWQCGGTLETIPCSRVGHVFRSFHPYGLPSSTDTHGINTARMAEVWMDEYAELFYLHRPDLRKNPKIGDVTHRRVLREKLHCKSFQWYLDNVYKEKFVPVRDAFGYGRFRNPATQYCIDSMQRETEGAALGTYPCHTTLQATQYLTLSLAGDLRDEERCADVNYIRKVEGGEEDERHVIMMQCRQGKNRPKWRYSGESQQVRHLESGLCLEASRVAGGELTARPCRAGDPLQRWEIDYTELNHFHNENMAESSEQEENLKKLRVQRRISRSLLSYPEDVTYNELRGESLERRDNVTAPVRRRAGTKPERRDEAEVEKRDGSEVERQDGSESENRQETDVEKRDGSGSERRHHKQHDKKSKRQRKSHNHKHRSKHKKRGIKNKFVLKLVRKSPSSGMEEHLEADIHCKHRRLYPNNSFVRDLVTILNDRDIKVINNGRLFEKNRVTEIGKSAEESKPKVTKESEKRETVRVETSEPWTEAGVTSGVPPTIVPPAQQLKNVLRNKKRRMDHKKFLSGVNIRTTPRKREKEKKIIVEEFVEVTPPQHARTEPAHVQKKKSRRGRIKSPTSAPSDLVLTTSRPREWIETARVTTPRSAEEAPAGSVELRARTHEPEQPDKQQDANARKTPEGREVDPDTDQQSNEQDEITVVSRKRPATHARDVPDADTDSEPRDKEVRPPKSPVKVERKGDADTEGEAGTEGAPLKVVMRSNLTFNLADDFFNWRKRSRDDLQEVFEAVGGSVSADRDSSDSSSSSAHND